MLKMQYVMQYVNLQSECEMYPVKLPNIYLMHSFDILTSCILMNNAIFGLELHLLEAINRALRKQLILTT